MDKDIYISFFFIGGVGEPFFMNTPRSYHHFGIACNIAAQLATLTTNISEMMIVTAEMLIVQPPKLGLFFFL